MVTESVLCALPEAGNGYHGVPLARGIRKNVAAATPESAKSHYRKMVTRELN